ncbi:MAG: Ppx/GppA family phosphatase [Microthrixaceae bacterium]|nr:Ppx/GppA family phosphatase [Microthrixaceae bacterium]
MPEVVAAIDVGTNSVHMVVARSVPSGRFETLTKHKEPVRLGSGLGDRTELSADAMDRGVAAIRRCAEMARGFDAQVRAVATSAVREASNSSEFVARVLAEAGVAVEVISGVEEARLIQLGVLQALPVFDKRFLLVDVGGGSTEVLVGEGTEVLFARSHKLGAIRMTRDFFTGDQVRQTQVDACRKLISARLAAAAHEAAPLLDGVQVAVACSGTAETLVAMGIARSGRELPGEMNGQQVSRKAVSRIIGDLAAAPTTEARSRIPGIDSSRADILLGGALVLEGVCRAFGVKHLTFSDYALREGVLLDAFARRRSAAMHHLSDLRRASVMHLLETCDDDPAHAVRVARHALALFDLLAPRLGLEEADLELLEAAALLANVGLSISHSAHHKHSYYVIRNSERLTGFTDHEKELIALVARYHRKSAPSEAKHPEFAALEAGERARVRAMAAILRVAIALDRNHDGGVAGVELVAGTGPAGGDGGPAGPVLVLHPAEPGRELELELFSAADRVRMLEECLGERIRFALG